MENHQLNCGSNAVLRASIIFGCLVADCFVHVPKQRRHKWDKKSVPGRFTGYCDEKDGYRVWLPDEGRVVVSRDVIFKPEEIVPSTELCIKPTESTSDGLEVVLSKRCVEVGAEEWTSTKRKVEEDVNTEPPAEQEEAQSDPQPSRSKRLVTKPKKYLTDYVLSAEASFPTTFREAMESAEAVHWSKAMNEELCSLKENSVWSLVDLPPGKKVLNTRWVLRVKAKAAGTAISWFSQKQKGVALSTTEAEYVAASEAAKELIWLKNLYNELAVVQPKPTLFVDNMGAVKLSKNPEFHKRTKHIAVRFHFVREKWKEGEFDVQHIGGEHQKADILTKALAKPRFEALRCQLGLVTLSMKR
uniref:Reverse transcriptase Ty1/copia-type domain-containing protein n=1 Tax=Trichuris muris TaxID=70415 RepID=A0A5S6Q5K6_TRIMR